jgi:hypothetical protein
MNRFILPLVIILYFSGCIKFAQIQDKYNIDEISYNFLSSVSSEQKSDSLYSVIKDNMNELDNSILEEIVYSYFSVFDINMSFNENDVVEYERAFQYIRCAGTYPIDPFEHWKIFGNYYNSRLDKYTIPVEFVNKLILEDKIKSEQFDGITIIDNNYIVEGFFWTVRQELHQYFNKDTWMVTVPAKIVDEYILSKFNTKIDHSRIKEYDENSDTYTYEPFRGSIIYNVLIKEVIVKDEIVRFKCTLVNEMESILYQVTFVIKLVDGEYKIISVDIKDDSI